MWDRRCDDVNRTLDNLTYEINQLMPDHDWLKIISTAILDQGFDLNQRFRYESEV